MNSKNQAERRKQRRSLKRGHISFYDYCYFSSLPCPDDYSGCTTSRGHNEFYSHLEWLEPQYTLSFRTQEYVVVQPRPTHSPLLLYNKSAPETILFMECIPIPKVWHGHLDGQQDWLLSIWIFLSFWENVFKNASSQTPCQSIDYAVFVIKGSMWQHVGIVFLMYSSAHSTSPLEEPGYWDECWDWMKEQ